MKGYRLLRSGALFAIVLFVLFVLQSNFLQEPVKARSVKVTKLSEFLPSNISSVSLGDVLLQKINTHNGVATSTMIQNHSGHTIKVTSLKFESFDANLNAIDNQVASVNFANGGLPMYGGQTSPLTTWPQLADSPAVEKYRITVTYVASQ
ncbi:MAG: hypothetical protein ACXVPK_07330 [Tumebacillaceae bacterium]